MSEGAVEGTVSNGMVVADNGGFLIANFGTGFMERIKPNGDLGDKEIFGLSDTGAFVDGITFDSYGDL